MLGASEEQIDAMRKKIQKAEDPFFGVWEENAEVFGIFVDLEPQWVWDMTRKRPMRDTIPTPRIESYLRLSGIPRLKWPKIFRDLQDVIKGVLRAQNSQIELE